MCCGTASRVTSGCGARRTTAAPWRSICSSRAAWSCRGAARIGEDGQPSGDLTLWNDFQFPFDPALRGAEDLTLLDVSRNGDGAGCEVEEECLCDASGIAQECRKGRERTD